MIAGLPVESWLLLVFSVGLPLYIVLRFFVSHRRKPDGDGGGEP